MSNAKPDKPAGQQYPRATLKSHCFLRGWVQTDDCPEGKLTDVELPPTTLDVLAVVGEWAMVQEAGPPKTIPAFGHWGTPKAELMRVPFVVEVSRLVFEDQAAAPEATCAA